MNMLATFGLAIAGAVGAKMLDSRYPDKTKTVGPLTLTPGAMAAGAGAAALLLTRGKLPGASLLGPAVLGAGIVEGAQIAETQVRPLVAKFFPDKVSGEDYVGGYLTTGIPGGEDWSLAQSLSALRG